MGLSFFIPVFLFFLNWTNQVFGSVQCNLGLKLYSVESGKAVCAPFGHYGCTESCEWNSTCTQTSHFIAFKGRRTYVTGFILTENNFLLQCCASLGTIIQMNRRQEPLCVWTSWVNSVEMMGSLRMDPPLSKNEYIRDIMMERVPKSGKVQLRLQICKFLTQRTNCDREKMAAEERHHYSLLLLRLYRTQLFRNSTGTLSKSAVEAVNDERLRPASALFSVVSRIDERREVGRLLSGTAGGLSSQEEFPKTSELQPLQRFESNNPGPQLNTEFWDDHSGIPKSNFKNSPPPGILPPSSFNFDIVPANAYSQTPQSTQKIQIIRRPQFINSRRLQTNSTKEFVTRYTKVKDQSPIDRKALFEESPLKNTLQIRKIGEQENERSIAHHISTNTPIPPHLPSTTSKPFAVSLPPGYWKRVSVSPRPFAPKQIRPNPLHGLLACCQSQAPGCRQLCTKDVSKDEIRQALVSQECPPLSMTSVIGCFPQFYNTSSVSTCCSRSESLPKQCLSLCAPEFKPTLAHLACIDHISTIVDCYRDLMR
ncbi:hypothetical protein FO519_003498 [Halicephalobus sp. NKZ332]|nr:hypothetical protein FO519_003498 [Halicephalobus sp. NKZ332]